MGSLYKYILLTSACQFMFIWMSVANKIMLIVFAPGRPECMKDLGWNFRLNRLLYDVLVLSNPCNYDTITAKIHLGMPEYTKQKPSVHRCFTDHNTPCKDGCPYTYFHTQ